MKFQYVQIGCQDYVKLADFYKKVCDFKETDDHSWLNGKEGIVLKAPGFENDNPVYFGFIKATSGKQACINDVGYAHTCYETIDVPGAVERLVKYGGKFQSTMKNPFDQPCVYCKDIEGNVVEFHIPFPSPDCKIGKTLACLLRLKKDKGIRKETGESSIKFIHVNMISHDWKELCDYYNMAFKSSYFGKMKDHSGKFKESVIGIDGVHVVGYHILMPGFHKSYPTLEIFTYSIKGREKPCNDDSLGINAVGYVSDNYGADLDVLSVAGGSFIKKEKKFIKAKDIQDNIIYIRVK